MVPVREGPRNTDRPLYTIHIIDDIVFFGLCRISIKINRRQVLRLKRQVSEIGVQLLLNISGQFTRHEHEAFTRCIKFPVKSIQLIALQVIVIQCGCIFPVGMMKSIHIFIDQAVSDEVAFLQVHFQSLFLVLLVDGQLFFRKNTFRHQFRNHRQQFG